ncbi:MAG: hypothetical protein ABH823_05740 [bacterium]
MSDQACGLPVVKDLSMCRGASRMGKPDEPILCAENSPKEHEEPVLLTNPEYMKRKSEMIADIEREFIAPQEIVGDLGIRYEGYLRSWQVMSEMGMAEQPLRGRAADQRLAEALEYFTEFLTEYPCFKQSAWTPALYKKVQMTKAKIDYWRIRMSLTLLGDIASLSRAKLGFMKKLFDHAFSDRRGQRHSIREFFGLGIIDSAADPRQTALLLLQQLKVKAESYGDPVLLAEIYLKLGQLQPGSGGEYFKLAAEEAQKVIADPKEYRRDYINNRVGTLDNPVMAYPISNYFQVHELYRAQSTAHGIIAQALCSQPNFSLSDLEQALGHVVEAERILLEQPKRKEYIDRTAIDFPKGSVYQYSGDVYLMLGLELQRANILATIGVMLKPSCPDEAAAYSREANDLLDRIIAWQERFAADRKDCVYIKYLKGRGIERQSAVEKCLALGGVGGWKLHPHAPGEGTAIFSEEGALIIGRAYLMKAALLEADPARAAEAAKYRDEAQRFLSD